MIWEVLLLIVFLFLLFTFSKKYLEQIINLKICSICATVSLTWITLLILKFGGFEISTLLIGILMGESITGILYLFEKKAKKENKDNLLWVKILIIILGTALVYLLLKDGVTLIFSIVLIITLVLGFIIYLKLRGTTIDLKKVKQNKFGKDNKLQKELKKLEERFEHCCD